MLKLAFFGDIVGEIGRRAFLSGAARVREEHGVRLVVVNAENARNGSGLHPEGYREIRGVDRRSGRALGADALTMGDHVFADTRVKAFLEDPAEPILRPANLSVLAPGKRSVRLCPDAKWPPIVVVTVLGRLFMKLPADDPFAALDRELSLIAETDPDALVVAEVHAEATSEKQALAWHCARKWGGRVVAVVGTHTHVPTADARLLDGAVAAITDLGMCGPRASILGREVDLVLKAMTTQYMTNLDVATGDPAAQGVVVTIDPERRRAVEIVPVQYGRPAEEA